MVFSSLFFIYVFFAVFLVFYFKVANGIKAKNAVIIIFSLLFYAWGDPAYIVLLLCSTILNYVSGRLIDMYRDRFFAKFVFGISLAVNIGMLMVFKYTGFIMENINSIFSLDLYV
ncbi:MAG: MBOAT family protein, partial [Oscillospiraceae bacterium]|nr:MBOAT family protein [Oscillospiraceae bacterium]